ncbi:MAG: ComF family protein [Clostridia bacterium]
MNKLKELLKNIFSAKYSCVSCKREIEEGTFLCEACEKSMPFITAEKRCRICGRYADNPAEICEACVGSPKHFDKGLVVFTYDDKIRRMILRLKFHNALNLLDYFIPLMEDKLKEFGETIDCVTFIPMSKMSERSRGYNQSRKMAEMLSKRRKIAFFDGIIKVKKTATQKTLNFEKRKQNLKNAFLVMGDVKGKTVLVVDDVTTTGATFDEISKALKKRGATRVLTLCIAATKLNKVM